MTAPHACKKFALLLLVALWSAQVLPQEKKVDAATWIKDLRDGGVDVRLKAIKALGERGPTASVAIPDLVKALDDGDRGVRWAAASALGRVGPEALPSLLQALVNGNQNTRLGATVALGTLGPEAKDAVPSLINVLKDQTESIRENAARALGTVGPEAEPAIPALIQSLSDEDPFVNGNAADALSRIGKKSVPALVKALKDETPNVRWCAAIALGKMGPDAQEAVPALTQALQDKDDNIRWCSVIALGNIGMQARVAVPALTRALSDKDEDVRWGASLALERIDPEAREKISGWSSIAATIDTLTPQLMNELHVPGVSIALISHRALVWSNSYGVADVNRAQPVTKETLFEACSMTKPVFVYTVMKLVEQGKLDLDRPLVEYLEESCLRDQPHHTLITARMVLSHTSGLPNWRKGEEERDGPLPVKFKPGSRFGYSGEGMFYLQRVVEHITGEPVDTYAKRSLFDPLGLRQTSYVWTKDLDARLASGHNPDGTFLRKTKYTHPNVGYTLYTTADEYAMFLIEIMKPDRSARHSLSQQSIDAMLTRQVKVDSREPIERPGKAKGSAVYWGLGWSINATEEGDIIHHSGANRSGFRCFSQFNPGKGSGIVIMTNSMSGGDLWSRIINEIGDQYSPGVLDESESLH